ncbi:MAG: methyltransferase domain-containing protein [Gammaproteobacteria bacterium]|nr:methyltransferase domain-containing protein [Gammaproteobacteria bacterium]
MKQDRNFDDLSHRFKRKIYDSPKGVIRLEVVWEDLLESLPELQGPPLRILDAGAGMGQIALRLAKLGHEVVLCDHSTEMLQLAKQCFTKELPSANIQFIHAPVQQLHEHIEGQFDLVLFHAVLEWLAEPETTLHTVMRYCRPGAALSLLFYNRHALAYLNLIKGNLRKVAAGEFQGNPHSLTPTHPLDPDEVRRWVEQSGMTIIRKSGVRFFHDMMWPDAREKCSLENIVLLERQLARQEPFASLGRYVHLLARSEVDNVSSR